MGIKVLTTLQIWQVGVEEGELLRNLLKEIKNKIKMAAL